MELKRKREPELHSPEIPVPPPEAFDVSEIPFFMGSTEQDKALLRELVTVGARDRFGEIISKEIRERLNYELDVILRQKDVVSYMLIVQDFVATARKIGAIVGPGRGAVAGSLVAYVLGITSVNPLQHDLLFERFINPDRIVHPWIMVDFDEEGQQKVFGCLAKRYGKDHVARISTYTMTEDGRIRKVGVHESGIVLSRSVMAERVPLITINECEMAVSAYDERHVETVGPIRFDVCGLGALTLQRKCLQIIRGRTGERLDLDNIHLDDAETLGLFAQGEMDDVFQFESEEMRRWLCVLKPTTFEQLVILNALNWPWLKEKIPLYIERSTSVKDIPCLHPLMTEYLAESFGLTIFQEQVMLMSRRLGGFTRGQADKLRKALCKKKSSVIEDLRPIFISGCLSNPDFRTDEFSDEARACECAERIWEEWKRDVPYSVCEVHAVCCTKIAYQTQYLKAHYPEEFFRAKMQG